MELALSLGDLPKSPFPFFKRNPSVPMKNLRFNGRSSEKLIQDEDLTVLPSLQLCLPYNLISEPSERRIDVNRLPELAGEEEEAAVSSPNSELGNRKKRDWDGYDEEENCLGRRKLRLSKNQSYFLEQNFKQHTTLNPKQKLALAKELNIRPRQVEVWFQNRRARMKLKQTEVDCEYLRKLCETLREENKRLQKELHELRVLKTSQLLYMQLPATTLIMCSSCQKPATTLTATATEAAIGSDNP